jgi:hypothetical protein
MGFKISDGKAFDAAAPSSTVINDGDLYRVGGFNGFAIGAKDATQADRTLSFEMDQQAWWKIKLPDGLEPDPGDLLYWDDPSAFQAGEDDLQASAASPGDRPACEVVESINDAGYATVRVLNP